MGGNQSVPKITAQDRAILDLKLQRDKVKQYQKNLQAILDREEVIAKQHLAAGHKDRALVALRRRKYQQGLLLKTDGQLENLQQLVSTIEFSLIEVSVLHGLKQGNEVLKKLHKEMNPESVERLLEETAEAREYQRVRQCHFCRRLEGAQSYFVHKEIDEMLANNLSLDEEDAVQAELRALQADVAETVSSRDVHLPSAPMNEPVAGPEEEVNRDPARVAVTA
ncbi:Snf7-domain-containing protein [Lentinula guzmanii]|uniref:Snf7-domain-containing protein n=1 Tax=Lentinula guzmanii TaxID=2804957 RepID=A0AA38JRG3_9AGAR|nr:Snf7-domain-containing protein [Lentinula guzmanii]